MTPRNPIVFEAGQRVCVDWNAGRAFKATIIRPHTDTRFGGGQFYRTFSGDNEWVVQVDGHDGQNIAGDSEMQLLVTPEGLKNA